MPAPLTKSDLLDDISELLEMRPETANIILGGLSKKHLSELLLAIRGYGDFRVNAAALGVRR